MNSHKHARLTAKGRALLVSRVLEHGWTVVTAAEAAGVSRRTGYKWLARFKAGWLVWPTAARGRSQPRVH